MTYQNGKVGYCACGQLATVHCEHCGRVLCDAHAQALPQAPRGVSANARARYEIAVRSSGGTGAACETCRADAGAHALQAELSAPRAELPGHWLDRAMALHSDDTRSEAEKLADLALPPTLTANEVAQEFLRRNRTQPVESVVINLSGWLRHPEHIQGWSVDCRRTEYSPGGSGPMMALPSLISINGEILGPALDPSGRQGPVWWIVPESDIDLPRLVRSVARLLMLSGV